MENSYYIFGIISGLVSVIAVLFYVRSIFKKGTKPNRISWLIWLVTGSILLATSFSVGATTTIFVPIAYVINPLVVLFLSFRFGVSSWSRLDRATLFIAFLSLVVWFLTNNPLLALLMVLTMDVVGFFPTIKKSFQEPHTESPLYWLLISIGTIFNIFAIEAYSFGIVVYAIVMLVMNGAVAAILYYQKIFKTKKLFS